MKFINRILEFFRKKDYYQVDFNDLNSYSIIFKEIEEKDLIKIKKVISEFPEVKSIYDKSKFMEKDALIFSDLENLMLTIKETISNDYKETYFESLKENWAFNYFLSDSNDIYKNVILINNHLSYPKTLNKGSVIYPLAAIKKFRGKYYFWDLLEE